MNPFRKILKWRRDSADLQAVREARKISRQAALNALTYTRR